MEERTTTCAVLLRSPGKSCLVCELCVCVCTRGCVHVCVCVRTCVCVGGRDREGRGKPREGREVSDKRVLIEADWHVRLYVRERRFMQCSEEKEERK